jgi:hypothetical protein
MKPLKTILLFLFGIFFSLFFFAIVLAGGCQDGLSCSGTSNCGCTRYRVDPGETITVFEHNLCQRVTNNSGYPQTFIPAKTQTEWNLFCAFRPNHISCNSCPSASGTLACSSATSSSITLGYSYNNGSSVSLFRGSTLLTTFGSGNGSGNYTDTGLSSNTSYTYYLRNGSSSSSPLLAHTSCSTSAPSFSLSVSCSTGPLPYPYKINYFTFNANILNGSGNYTYSWYLTKRNLQDPNCRFAQSNCNGESGPTCIERIPGGQLDVLTPLNPNCNPNRLRGIINDDIVTATVTAISSSGERKFASCGMRFYCISIQSADQLYSCPVFTQIGGYSGCCYPSNYP